MSDSILDRRSIRKYEARDVEQEKIMQILEAARQAPSASNRQPWKFIIIRDEDVKKAIVAADHEQEWMLEAPVFIAFIADPKSLDGTPCGPVDEDATQMDLKRAMRDTGAAIENALIRAQELGLGTCWTAWYTQAEMRPALGVPDNKYVVGVVTVGYPAQEPHARPRIPMEELLMYDRWGNYDEI